MKVLYGTDIVKEGVMATASRQRQGVSEDNAVHGRILDAAFAAFMKSGYARTSTLQVPADMPVPHDRETLARVLASFGAQLVREVSDPSVIAVFRLAIAEAVHAPEVARALDSVGRETSRAALRQVMEGAQSAGLLKGSPAALAEQFGGLLWGDLIVSLLLGVVGRPNPREVTGRARDAAAAFLQ